MRTPKTKGTIKEGAAPHPNDRKHLFYSKSIETHLFCDVGRIIASELEPVELVQKIIASLNKAIQFEDASVYLVKSDLTGLVPVYLRDPVLRSRMSEPVYFDTGAPGEIAAKGEPLFLENASLHESFLHHPDETQKPGSYMGIPLMNENRIVGIMGFSHSRPSAFSVVEFDLLRTLSHTISAGLEKAELFRKTLESARTDELTGMLNYRVLLENLLKEVSRQVRSGRPFSFIMVDIDNFKRINDRYGHLEGSRVIAQMGAILREACRSDSTDTCFRYGGEEFSVLLAETDREDAMMVAERVRSTIEEFPFSIKAMHPSEVITVSLGVSTRRKDDAKDISAVIHESDIALYHSKSMGKNRVTGYDETLTMPGEKLDRDEWKP